MSSSQLPTQGGSSNGQDSTGDGSLTQSRYCIYCHESTHNTWDSTCMYICMDYNALALRMETELAGFVPPCLEKTQCSSLAEILIMDLQLGRGRQIRFPYDEYGYFKFQERWTAKEYYTVFRDVLEYPGVRMPWQTQHPTYQRVTHCFRCGVEAHTRFGCPVQGQTIAPCTMCSDGHGGCNQGCPDCHGDSHCPELCEMWHDFRKMRSHISSLHALRPVFGSNPPQWFRMVSARASNLWRMDYAPDPATRAWGDLYSQVHWTWYFSSA